ncbi:MAG: aldo/keto reductase [Microbacteriaceae bacterium]|nr:aldo/keto reductase [Burkholderiaceae bacterium]
MLDGCDQAPPAAPAGGFLNEEFKNSQKLRNERKTTTSRWVTFLPEVTRPATIIVAIHRAGRGDARMLQTESRDESLLIAQTLKLHCERKGVALSHFATAWVLANRAVSAVIARPRTLAQWQDYFGALECAISVEDEALVDSLVRPGHPSTPGYNDPAYPRRGDRSVAEPAGKRRPASARPHRRPPETCCAQQVGCRRCQSVACW